MSKKPQVLTHTVKVTLTRATNLAAGDYVGKSDPYVVFRLDDHVARSSCCTSTLNPVWSPSQQFEFKTWDPEDKILYVDVYDHDLLSRDDLLGSIEIQLYDLMTQVKRGSIDAQAYTLDVPTVLRSSEEAAEKPSLLFLTVTVIPLDNTELQFELWENETWLLGHGWSADRLLLPSRRCRWSNEEGVISSDNFQDVAPVAPLGYQSMGWSFRVVGKGDQEGWLYATTFAGPWYPESNAVTIVRRRKWVNICQRPPSMKALLLANKNGSMKKVNLVF